MFNVTWRKEKQFRQTRWHGLACDPIPIDYWHSLNGHSALVFFFPSLLTDLSSDLGHDFSNLDLCFTVQFTRHKLLANGLENFTWVTIS